MSFFGKEVRMRRSFNEKSKKILIIALDHAIGWGVIEGISKINDTLEKIIAGEPDAITTAMSGRISVGYKSPLTGTIK